VSEMYLVETLASTIFLHLRFMGICMVYIGAHIMHVYLDLVFFFLNNDTNEQFISICGNALGIFHSNISNSN
jgi:hypothetical protein